jgi:hypothetical protein
LKHLIPVLRVSGVRYMLYLCAPPDRHPFSITSDYLHWMYKCATWTLSLNASGQWLARKWIHCQKKKNAALEGLKELGVDEDMLRAEWAAQVADQTKPIARK